MSYESLESIPQHIRASMSKAERARVDIILTGPKLGHPWLTEHRRLEVLAGDRETHKFFAGYFPHEALRSLEQFADRHWRAEPNAESPVGERLRVYYPKLFSNLHCRLTALFEITDFAPWRERFEELESAYLFDLTGADRLARNLDKEPKKKRRHEDYRLAFGNIYEPLQALLTELVSIGQIVWKQG